MKSVKLMKNDQENDDIEMNNRVFQPAEITVSHTHIMTQ